MSDRLRTCWPLPALALLLTCLIGLSGCNMVGWMAHSANGGKQIVTVDAQYEGLANQRVAVLVAANEFILLQYPAAPAATSRAISQRIAANVEGTTLTSPRELSRFQNDNPYWATVPTGRIARELNVDRVVLVDLLEFRTHEPGNRHILQGLIAAEVSVYEADGHDPDNPAFSTVVRAQFPEGSSIGIVDGTEEIVRVGMHDSFSRQVAWLFYRHEEER